MLRRLLLTLPWTQVRAVLTELPKHFITGVVSGRSLGKIRDFVGVKGLFYAGSHGFDILAPSHSAYSGSLGLNRWVVDRCIASSSARSFGHSLCTPPPRPPLCCCYFLVLSLSLSLSRRIAFLLVKPAACRFSLVSLLSAVVVSPRLPLAENLQPPGNRARNSSSPTGLPTPPPSSSASTSPSSARCIIDTGPASTPAPAPPAPGGAGGAKDADAEKGGGGAGGASACNGAAGGGKGTVEAAAAVRGGGNGVAEVGSRMAALWPAAGGGGGSGRCANGAAAVAAAAVKDEGEGEGDLDIDGSCHVLEEVRHQVAQEYLPVMEKIRDELKAELQGIDKSEVIKLLGRTESQDAPLKQICMEAFFSAKASVL